MRRAHMHQHRDTAVHLRLAMQRAHPGEARRTARITITTEGGVVGRIRSVKPEFFSSEEVAELSFRARLTWLGLWCYCDDRGRGRYNVKLIKADVWPLDDDVTGTEIEADLAELERNERIVRYAVDGKDYFYVPKFNEHQHPQKPKAKYPPPPDFVPSTQPVQDQSATATGLVLQGKEGRGEERRGEELARATERPPPPRPPAETNGRANQASKHVMDGLAVAARLAEQEAPE